MWGAFPHAHLFLACAFPTSFGPLAMSCERSHASVPTGSQLSSIFTAFVNYLMCPVFLAHCLFHPRFLLPRLCYQDLKQLLMWQVLGTYLNEWKHEFVKLLNVMRKKYLFLYDHLSFYFYCFLCKNDTFMASEFPILLKIFLHISWGYLYFMLDYLLKSFKTIYPIWNSFSALCKEAFVFFFHTKDQFWEIALIGCCPASEI